MTFTSPGGHVHMLRQLAPQLVYVEEKLAGLHGEHADQVKAWVGQVVVVVGGAGSGGLAGLVDTEDEGDAIDTAGGPSAASSSSKWWQSGDMVGLGKGIEVVDATRLQDDWQRRITGRD